MSDKHDDWYGDEADKQASEFWASLDPSAIRDWHDWTSSLTLSGHAQVPCDEPQRLSDEGWALVRERDLDRVKECA